MLIIAGTLRVDATDRAAYLDLVARATAMAREAPGCLDFAQSPDPLEPDRINVFERWESDAALQAFRDLPSDGESVPPVRAAEVRRYRISAVADA
ncbi:MAG TPA: antibiotic biosynthesis monooxygenase family protein [Mycobacterium sp.]|nr:antibiotic biosynthesis monooxygenase family protein [Mycobacterium sp.]